MAELNSEKDMHAKAIKLVEGDIMEVDGHLVKLEHQPYIFDPCFFCDMVFLCSKGKEIGDICVECDSITGEDCFMIMMDSI